MAPAAPMPIAPAHIDDYSDRGVIGDNRAIRVSGDSDDTYADRTTATTYGDAVPPSDLVSTPEAARALGVSARTLQRYVRAGLVTPEITLPSGQYRWSVSKLRAQIDAIGSR